MRSKEKGNILIGDQSIAERRVVSELWESGGRSVPAAKERVSKEEVRRERKPVSS